VGPERSLEVQLILCNYIKIHCAKKHEEHCVIRGETENVPHLLEDNYSPCTSVLSNFSKSLSVSACDSLLSDMFKGITGVLGYCCRICI